MTLLKESFIELVIGMLLVVDQDHAQGQYLHPDQSLTHVQFQGESKMGQVWDEDLPQQIKKAKESF